MKLVEDAVSSRLPQVLLLLLLLKGMNKPLEATILGET